MNDEKKEKLKCPHCNGKGFIIKEIPKMKKVHLFKFVKFLGGKIVNINWKEDTGKYNISDHSLPFFECKKIMSFDIPCTMQYVATSIGSLDEIINELELSSQRLFNPYHIKMVKIMLKKLQKSKSKIEEMK